MATVSKMQGVLRHRGPDEQGTYHDKKVALSFCRLSIIDLDGAKQPLFNEDSSLVLTCNGEIYNYRELRSKLAGRHSFSTRGDCETVLHLYEEYGTDCVKHLRGMFAFALWDSRRQQLLLARDRMGEKPLYFCHDENGLTFASELKAFIGAGVVDLDLDLNAVNLYYHYGYFPEPYTPIKGVRKLEAAHTMIINAVSGVCETKTYWSLESSPPIEGDPANIVKERLEAACRDIVESDVPVGVSLSGGLDSSILAILVKEFSSQPLHAFTAGYTGRPQCDERSDAARLAKELDINFHEVEIDTNNMIDEFPAHACRTDEPIADIAGFSYYSVMKAAQRAGIKVMIQGQGGDELFSGYALLEKAYHRCKLKEKAMFYNYLALPLYLKLHGPGGFRPWQIRRWCEEWFGARAGVESFIYDKGKGPFHLSLYDMTPDYREALYEGSRYFGKALRDEGDEGILDEISQYSGSSKDVPVDLIRFICGLYLRSNGIAQGDRLSMACSVEMRLPFVDYRLVEGVVGLRKCTGSGYSNKGWLKDAFRDRLPERLLTQIKRGFSPPSSDWMPGLFERYGHYLRGGELVRHGILSEAGVEMLSKGHRPNHVVSPLSFKSLVLEMWCRHISEYSSRQEFQFRQQCAGS